MRELGLAETEIRGLSLLDAINLPSLNINGMRAANVGEQASNVIPATASAELDLRLVKGNDPTRQYQRLVAHVEKQGYFVIEREPTDAERTTHALIATMKLEPGAYAASRTPMDLPIARAVAAAVESAAGDRIVRLPTMGGSLPLVVITDVLGADTLNVPIANHDNNQHAENENIRLGNLWDGIEIMAAVMRIE
jgi:acetylornithine deacetylase/succinyl-diaminopimelate desuccinylase-like protein